MSQILLIADYIYTPEGYISNHGVVFEENILAIDTLDVLSTQFPQAQIVHTPPHTILYPGLINTHVHLEFSANRSRLEYGDFMGWLHSVIEHRDDLVAQCDNAMMEAATDDMLRSGITAFGAISSFGGDLEVCRRIPQRVTYFNELIGSSAASADMLYGDFLERLTLSMHTEPDDNITPAIAIHAPYSVHPVLLHKAIALAREKQLPLSTHFLESPAEREWLESHSGGFLGFFQKFFSTDRAVTSIDEFIHAFDQSPALFVHCTQTTSAEREHLSEHGHTVAHCPRSNRLLDCGRLPIEDLQAPLTIATDGLSSNWSLSLWDELRAALMLHHKGSLIEMADRFIRSVTLDAACAIGHDGGRIVTGAPADLVTIVLPEQPEDIESLSLHVILHAQEAERVYISGKKVV